jgi:hypothetical protein
MILINSQKNLKTYLQNLEYNINNLIKIEMKNLTKNDLKKVIADLKRNLENLFACGFYSETEYKTNMSEIEYLELTLN